MQRHVPTGFGRIVWAGIAANLIISCWGLVAPDSLLTAVHLEKATPLVWPRFASLLLILLSLFYVPAALDPARNRVTAVLTVLARAAGVAFFTMQGGTYILFGLYDFAFGLPQAIFLILLFRKSAGVAPNPVFLARGG
jgi:hypothetical protein